MPTRTGTARTPAYFIHRGSACLVLGWLCLLCGCGSPDTSDLPDIPITVTPPRDDGFVRIQAGPAAGNGAASAGTRGDLTAPLASAGASDEEIRKARLEAGVRRLPDYEKKCDAYWKLNWIRRELLAGHVPHDLPYWIQHTRAILATTTPDGNFDLGNSALGHLEKGLAHMRTAQSLRAAGVDYAAAPWSGGRSAMQRFVDGTLFRQSTLLSSSVQRAGHDIMDDDPAGGFTSHGASSSGLGEDVSPAKSAAAAAMLNYASTYAKSPQEMMRSEWKLAILDMNKLRDNLALRNRAENSDGDSTDVGAGVTVDSSVGGANGGGGAIDPPHFPHDSSGAPINPFDSATH